MSQQKLPAIFSRPVPCVAEDQAMATCRRAMIAEALGERGGGAGLCGGGGGCCDVCSGGVGLEAVSTIDATSYALTLVR